LDSEELVSPDVANLLSSVSACTVLSSIVGAELSALTIVPPYAVTMLLMFTT
jgi:hypothetical protein